MNNTNESVIIQTLWLQATTTLHHHETREHTWRRDKKTESERERDMAD